MTTENQRVVALETRQQQPLNGYSSAAEILPELAGCFALVRPVSMTDDAAAEWLAVAANELAGYETCLLRSGTAHARRTCTHHGQIIPAIIKKMEDMTPWRMGQPLDRRLPNRVREQLPPPEIRGLIEGAARSLKDAR